MNLLILVLFFSSSANAWYSACIPKSLPPSRELVEFVAKSPQDYLLFYFKFPAGCYVHASNGFRLGFNKTNIKAYTDQAVEWLNSTYAIGPTYWYYMCLPRGVGVATFAGHDADFAISVGTINGGYYGVNVKSCMSIVHQFQ